MSPRGRHGDEPRHWIVLGMLLADNRFERRPGFVSDVGAVAEDPKSPLHCELLDAAGRVLLRAGIPLGEPCADGPNLSFRMASGVIPVPAGTAAARFVVGDVVVEEFQAPEGEPEVAFTALPDRGARGVVRVAWEAEHPSGAELTSALAFSSDDGKTWQPVGLPTSLRASELDLDGLPGGEGCRLCLKTTDGFHTVTTVSEAFALPIRSCLAMILAPEQGLRIESSSTLRLQGQGYWLEEQRPELEALRWSSSLDGPLGTGPVLEVTDLEPGSHEIVLEAGDGERVGRTSVEVEVVAD
jgi:hypothetical protein